jgi:hypothetical protein
MKRVQAIEPLSIIMIDFSTEWMRSSADVTTGIADEDG